MWPDSTMIQKDIAKKFGVHAETIVRAAKAEGLPKRHGTATRYNAPPDGIREEIKRLIVAGHSRKSAAELVGITKGAAINIARRLDLPKMAKSPVSALTENDKDELDRLRSSGATRKDVAAHFGISLNAAGSRLRKARAQRPDVKDKRNRVAKPVSSVPAKRFVVRTISFGKRIAKSDICIHVDSSGPKIFGCAAASMKGTLFCRKHGKAS